MLYDVEVSRTVTKGVLTKVFEHLKKENLIPPDGIVLVTTHTQSEKDDLKVAEYTNEVLLECVPECSGNFIFIRWSIRRRGESKIEFNAQVVIRKASRGRLTSYGRALHT